MPLDVTQGNSTMFVRRDAFERTELTRQEIDELLLLTPDEFRVEGNLIAIGPIYDPDRLAQLVVLFEERGLADFDEFFELSGGWPPWLRVLVLAQRSG
jgi:hypothetical protein